MEVVREREDRYRRYSRILNSGKQSIDSIWICRTILACQHNEYCVNAAYSILILTFLVTTGELEPQM